MKTQPTEIDREGVQLFTPAPGMHVAYSLRGSVEWGRCIMTEAGMKLCSEHWTAHTVVGVSIVAIDTDDMPTCGAMLEQVEAAAGHRCMVACGSDVDRNGPYSWVVRKWTGHDIDRMTTTPFGATRGAAMVAAMRALKSKTRRE